MLVYAGQGGRSPAGFEALCFEPENEAGLQGHRRAAQCSKGDGGSQVRRRRFCRSAAAAQTQNRRGAKQSRAGRARCAYTRTRYVTRVTLGTRFSWPDLSRAVE